MRVLFVILLLGLSQAFALSVHEQHRRKAAAEPARPMENEGLFEGDILGIDPFDRNAMINKRKLWTNNTVYYQFHPSMDSHKPVIRQAMDQYVRKTNGCLKFIESTGSGNYLFITSHSGCYSFVGMNGGKQIFNLGPGCYSIGTIVHEFGHALGLHHEQNRSDRDKYLKIHDENVMPGLLYNFKKLTPSQNLLMTPYDYDSIMHYGAYAFSVGNKITIEVLDKKHHIRSSDLKPGLTDMDAFIINSLYSCPGYTRPPPIELPDDKCDFENGMCFFENSRYNSGKAVVVQEKHSNNHYLRTDKIGTSASIMSARFEFDKTDACITFDYKVEGTLDGLTYFKAYLRDVNGHKPFVKAFEMSDTHGWKKAKLPFKDVAYIWVNIDVELHKTLPSAFGMDNFTLHHHAC